MVQAEVRQQTTQRVPIQTQAVPTRLAKVAIVLHKGPCTSQHQSTSAPCTAVLHHVRLYCTTRGCTRAALMYPCRKQPANQPSAPTPLPTRSTAVKQQPPRHLRDEGQCPQLPACRLPHEVERLAVAAKGPRVAQHPGDAGVDVVQHVQSVALDA